jgi:O-antigen ligase
MFSKAIQLILICLFIFTPVAFGSMDIWAFSLMELGILLIISLYSIQGILFQVFGNNPAFGPPNAEAKGQGAISFYAVKKKFSAIPIVLLFLFLAVILFQLIPLPSGVVKILSPKTFEIRQLLSCFHLNLPPSSISGSHPTSSPLSLFPFATQIEFFKWLSLIGFFLFLLYGRLLDDTRIRSRLIIVIMLVGAGEAFYGMIEFFSGHRHILFLDDSSFMSSVTGTFINKNYFAGYLLMVIPLAMGFLLSRLAIQADDYINWRQILSSLEGKNLLIGFGIILMILGLFFSVSRMGIISLLLSFSLLAVLFRDPRKGKWFSKTSILLIGLALLWAGWIGLDAVISRFFSAPEDFKMRWMLWGDTLRIFKDFPVFGSGLGTFPHIFPMYRSFHIQGMVTHAENDFLQFISDVGLLGFGVLLIAFIFFLSKAVSGIRSISSPADSQRYICLGSLVGIFALVFHSLVERNIQIPANAFLFSFIFSLALKPGLESPIKPIHWLK